MTKIKICGIKEPDHAAVALTAGADFIGMVMVKGRRQVAVDKAYEIVGLAKHQGVPVVGVFAGITSVLVTVIICLARRRRAGT